MRDQISTPGFRTRQILLVTTPLAAAIYRVADLAALVPPALADRNRTGATQDDHADGRAAL